MAETPAAPTGVRVKLWDAPVRLIHWALVILLAFSWWASEDHLDWHRLSGYTILALLVFRIYWGFVGGEAARFANFVKGPRETVAFLKTMLNRAPAHVPGHNPVGALSVIVILGNIGLQIVTGLFTVDIDGFESGPLSYMVSFDTGRVFAEIHELSFRFLQVIVVLHVVAVLFYLIYKRTDLIRPMITGQRVLPEDPGLTIAPFWRLAVGAVLAFAVAWIVSKGLRI